MLLGETKISDKEPVTSVQELNYRQKRGSLALDQMGDGRELCKRVRNPNGEVELYLLAPEDDGSAPEVEDSL